MTRALLTETLRNELCRSGFFLVVDAGNLTVSVYHDTEKESAIGTKYLGLEKIGTLSYNSNSVDYDELMQIVRQAA